jgi:hypothetical protein
LSAAETADLRGVTQLRTVWGRNDGARWLKERIFVAIILVWLSILAGALTLVLVVSSLRKVIAQAGGVSRLLVATIVFSLITSALTILSLIAALERLGLT